MFKNHLKIEPNNLNEVQIACEKIDLAWEKNIMKDIFYNRAIKVIWLENLKNQII